MRLSQQLNLSQETLVLALNDELLKTNRQVNQLTEGLVAAVHNAMTAAPTTGSWKQGDFVRNSTPTEAGIATQKYVILGWIRTTSGSGNTLNTDWFACRALTGN